MQGLTIRSCDTQRVLWNVKDVWPSQLYVCTASFHISCACHADPSGGLQTAAATQPIGFLCQSRGCHSSVLWQNREGESL